MNRSWCVCVGGVRATQMIENRPQLVEKKGPRIAHIDPQLVGGALQVVEKQTAVGEGEGSAHRKGLNNRPQLVEEGGGKGPRIACR